MSTADVERSPYLAPDRAQGSRYGFDPDSPSLRAALTRPARHGDTPLSVDALLADLPFFRRLLQRQCASYPDLLQDRDFDPQAFFDGWAEDVWRSAQAISCRAGLVEPLVALRRVRPDNHLTFPGLETALTDDPRITFHEFQAELPAGDPPERWTIGDVPGARQATVRGAPLLRVSGEIVSVLTLSAVGPDTALTVPYGNGRLQLTRRAQTLRPRQRTPRVPAYEWRTAGDAAVIALRAFGGGAAVREQLRRLPADYLEHARHETLLFDLRDNGGGSLEYLDQWIRQARRGPWRTYPRLEVIGALWPCSYWNVVVERQIVEGSVDTPAAQAEREAVRATWPARPPPSPSLDAGDREGRGTQPYSGRVFVLVNRRSGSSGELAAVQLQRALGAIVIGERTRGVMQYGEARRFVLPRTGVVCQVPTKRFFFHEDVESVGWPVDCYVENIEQDAVDLMPHLQRVRQHIATVVPSTAP